MSFAPLCHWILSIVIFLPAVLAQSGPAPRPNEQVVFVCPHGAAKSVIAAALFNELATERGLTQRAVARGTNADAEYSPAVLKGLAADGIAIPKGKPELVSAKDLAGATHVVTLGAQLPSAPPSKTGLRAWDEIDMADGYAAARKKIEKRVRDLTSRMAMVCVSFPSMTREVHKGAADTGR